MASPVTPTHVCSTRVTGSASVCDKLKSLFGLADVLCEFWNWMFNADGTISNSFVAELNPYLTPTGGIIFWPVETAPMGWLVCNGQSLSRETYAALFAVIGTEYGSSGATTFNVPDMRARVAMGSDSTYAVASTGGAATHTLTEAELPAHDHALFVPEQPRPSVITEGTHPSATQKLAGAVDGGDGAYRMTPADDQDADVTSGLSGESGGTTGHNNLQPYLAGHWIIKT